MRTIEVSEVTKLVRQLCIDANYYPARQICGRRSWMVRTRRSLRSARPSSVK